MLRWDMFHSVVFIVIVVVIIIIFVIHHYHTTEKQKLKGKKTTTYIRFSGRSRKLLPSRYVGKALYGRHNVFISRLERIKTTLTTQFVLLCRAAFWT
jgi:hypothetical protein